MFQTSLGLHNLVGCEILDSFYPSCDSLNSMLDSAVNYKCFELVDINLLQSVVSEVLEGSDFFANRFGCVETFLAGLLDLDVVGHVGSY